jgi:hypothetical protein
MAPAAVDPAASRGPRRRLRGSRGLHRTRWRARCLRGRRHTGPDGGHRGWERARGSAHGRQHAP